MKKYLSWVKRRLEYFYLRLVIMIANLRRHHIQMRQPLRKILVVRLDEIGDMVLTTPFLRELRRNYPKAEITLVVKPAVYNLVELCPYVDKIKKFTKVNGRWAVFQNINRAKKFAYNELEQDYDLAIVPRFDSDLDYMAGAIAFYTGASRRIGYAPWVLPRKSKSDAGLEGFYTDFVPAREGVCHEVERNLDILRYLGCSIENSSLELWIDEHDEQVAKKLLPKRRELRRLVLVLSAGAKHKEWPIENYIGMVEFFRQENVLPILLGAGENTREYADEFCNACPEAIDLVGKCSLRETYAVMKQCEIFLGGDTGPMHMAVVAGLSGVVLFFTQHAPEFPIRFKPFNSNIRILSAKYAISSDLNQVIPISAVINLLKM